MKNVVATENKMGSMPMNRLILNMAIPMMISMFVQALYNVVDSIFVSYISEDALSALSLAFPVQNLMIGVGSGIGVGMNALLSRSLGEKNPKLASRIALNGAFLCVFGYAIFLIFGLFFANPFMLSQTDDVEIINFGTTYLQICSTVSFGVFGQMIFERMLQSTGKTHLSMIVQLIGAITNIILDPIFIFVFRMEVAGAAWDAIGQIVACVIGFILNIKKNKEIDLSFSAFRPDFALIRKILVIGIPSMLMIGIGSIMTYFLNQILISFSSTAVAVFGAYFKLQSFIFMPVIGLNNGIIPILAYNYGAKNYSRMKKVIGLGILYALIIMSVGVLLFQIFPQQLLMLFDASKDMLEVGIPALRIISLSYLFAGYCIISSSVFQALGRSMYSFLVSFGRQLVILLPVAYLLSLTGALVNVWWAFPIAELMSLTLSSVFLFYIMKKVSKQFALASKE